MTVNVLFVCQGNICRSPSAQSIFQRLVDNAGLSDQFVVDSCGTASFNIGKSPDPRAVRTAQHHGYAIDTDVARQIQDEDFHNFQFIVAMDQKNLSSLNAWAPADFSGEIRLLMTYCANGGITQVEDPYYAKEDQFEITFQALERGCKGLFQAIVAGRND